MGRNGYDRNFQFSIFNFQKKGCNIIIAIFGLLNDNNNYADWDIRTREDGEPFDGETLERGS